MVESRYELNNIKRENSDHHQNTGVPSAAAVAAASASLRNSFNSAAFGLDYTFYKNNSASSQSGQEYPNELHMSNEYSKSFANHMDIPPSKSAKAFHMCVFEIRSALFILFFSNKHIHFAGIRLKKISNACYHLCFVLFIIFILLTHFHFRITK